MTILKEQQEAEEETAAAADKEETGVAHAQQQKEEQEEAEEEPEEKPVPAVTPAKLTVAQLREELKVKLGPPKGIMTGLTFSPSRNVA